MELDGLGEFRLFGGFRVGVFNLMVVECVLVDVVFHSQETDFSVNGLFDTVFSSSIKSVHGVGVGVHSANEVFNVKI